MSWTRTYRPRSISELHSGSVREALQNILKSKHFPQSLLFAGPKGTGKTSTSRILAAILNSEANKEAVKTIFFENNKINHDLKDLKTNDELAAKIISGESYIVHELDAASHRGIDDIRGLKERIFLPPQQGLISVYILDEVHMLTTEAFNAFLKLLEEPPDHVVFILATTELHKIPQTIQSRCQLITFSQATEEELVNTLKIINEKEKLPFNDSALALLSSHADGSFRDAVKLLELSHTQRAYTPDEILTTILHLDTNLVPQLLQAVIQKSAKDVLSLFENARNKKVDQRYLVKELFAELHKSLLQSYNIEKGKELVSAKVALYFLKKLSTQDLLMDSPITHLPLELALLEIIDQAQRNGKKKSEIDTDLSNTSSSTNHNDYTIETITQEKDSSHFFSNFTDEQSSETKQNSPIIKSDQNNHKNTGDGSKLCQHWNNFVSEVARSNSTYAALLKSARPLSGEDGFAQIAVYYTFHHEQLSKFQHTKASRDAVQTIAGGHVNLEFIIDQTPANADLVNSDQNQAAHSQILQILS